MPVDDAKLVRDAMAGDREAFGRLVDRHRRAVWGTAYHFLGRTDDAQDATQEAFVQAFLHLRQLRQTERFAPWMRRITTNVCAQVLRRRASREVALDSVERLWSGDRADEVVSRLAVRDALGRLSEKTRLVLTLCCAGGYSHVEVAAFLEIPVATVRSRLQRA